MAGLRFVAQSPLMYTATSAKTLIQILAATNVRVLAKEFSIAFNGTSNTAAPIRVQIMRQTTAGTPGGDGGALTLLKINAADDETLQTTAQNGPTTTGVVWTTEPTAGNIIVDTHVHPQTGYTWQAPFGSDIVVIGGTRLAIRVTAAAEVQALCSLLCEE